MTPSLEAAPRRWARRRRAGATPLRAACLALLAFTSVVACEDSAAPDPESLRFGQVGAMRLVLDTPLLLGVGNLRQELEWGSDGLWTLRETVSYEGTEGESDLRSLTANQERSAGIYAEWITQVNENPGLGLFDPEVLDPFLDPTCTSLRARLVLTIHDQPRDQLYSWTRCAVGPLSSLTPVGAGPDVGASRVANAGLLARNGTLGGGFLSAFGGTVPFATIDRGEDSGAPLNGPLVLENADDWTAFWSEHSRSQGVAPAVDFTKDLVIVAAVGERAEAGDSVEVQRVLAVADGSLIEIHEQVPGNFCSPAERLHTPYHIVRAPRLLLPSPVRFTELGIQLVHCR